MGSGALGSLVYLRNWLRVELRAAGGGDWAAGGNSLCYSLSGSEMILFRVENGWEALSEIEKTAM